MRILDLALKDLSQIFRDRKSALFLVAMPIVFTAFMGFAYGRGVSGQSDTRLAVAVIDLDGASALSQQFQAQLAEATAIRLVPLTEQEAPQVDEQVRQGKLAAAVTIPEGFGRQVLTGEMVQLPVIADAATSAGRTAQEVIQTAAMRLLSAAEIGRISVEIQPAFADDAARQAALAAAVDQASQAWREPPFAVTLEKVAASADPSQIVVGDNPYTQASPGMLLMFVIFGLNTVAMVLVLERRTKTLQRLLTTSISRAEIIAGHILGMFVVVFLQEILLVVVGQVGFGVNYLREPLAVLLVMIALALWIACLGLFIGVVAKGDDQVTLLAMIAMFIFSALGGAWFPLEITGQTFSTIGHLTPGAWAMDGFKNIVLRGLGLTSVLLPVGVLLAYAGAFFGLAIWRFKLE
jgi:ABC-2 type transport system permease protein